MKGIITKCTLFVARSKYYLLNRSVLKCNLKDFSALESKKKKQNRFEMNAMVRT